MLGQLGGHARVGFIPTKVRNFSQSSQLPVWEFRREKDGFTSASPRFRRKPLCRAKNIKKITRLSALIFEEIPKVFQSC